METCPWDTFDPGTVAFCEDRLCSWIAEPSNTGSSLGYLLIGAWMLANAVRSRRSRSDGTGAPLALGAVAVAQLMIGVGSVFFHASGTFAGEAVDQIGMFLLSALILVFAAGPSLGWSSERTVSAYMALVAASTFAMALVRPIGIPLFAIELALGLGWQLRTWSTTASAERRAYRPFFVALALFGVSLSFWLADITRVLCEPTNHLVTGHAVWHVLNACSIERLGAFYSRRDRPPRR